MLVSLAVFFGVLHKRPFLTPGIVNRCLLFSPLFSCFSCFSWTHC